MLFSAGDRDELQLHLLRGEDRHPAARYSPAKSQERAPNKQDRHRHLSVPLTSFQGTKNYGNTNFVEKGMKNILTIAAFHKTFFSSRNDSPTSLSPF